MQKTKLGKRGPEITTVGFGAWAIGGRHWGPTDDQVSKQALHRVLDEGVNFIDTADTYGFGHSEKLIADVLDERNCRDEVIVAGKAGNDWYNPEPDDDSGYGAIVSNADKDYMIFACEQSLKRLKTDCLDILQLHSHPTELLERDDPWEALATLKEQGKIKHAGWSVQSFKETEQAYFLDRHHEIIDVIQVRYNILEREAEKVLFPKALKHGIGVIVRIPLLFGLTTGKFNRQSKFHEDDHRRFNLDAEKLDQYLTEFEKLEPFFNEFPDQSKAQVSLRFNLSHPATHVVIPGAKTAEQVADNSKASALGPIPEDVLKKYGLLSS